MNGFVANHPVAAGVLRRFQEKATKGGSVIREMRVSSRKKTQKSQKGYPFGDANAVIDPMGIETRWENDQACRRIRLIEGIAPSYVVHALACSNPPYPPHPTPRITEFLWHASGQLAKLTLVNAETGNQDTRWVFGATLADSAIASNQLVRAKIYPESDDRPAPAIDGPDGVYSRLEYRYNRQGQQTEFKDADGTTHAYTYNKAGAMLEDAVTELAAGLNDDVWRINYSHDNRGMTSKVTSYNATSGGMVVNEVELEYDAFMQLAADKQSHVGSVDGTTPEVTYAYESGGTKNSTRRVSTTYPNGRVLETNYGASNSIDDHLGRVSVLQVDGETDELVNYTYCGRAWQVRVGYPAPELELTYRALPGAPVGDAGDPYSGYDRFGRTVDMPWVSAGDDSLVERSQYGFDRDSRRTWQKRPLTTLQDQHYGYDTLSQVSAAARGSLNTNLTAISGTPVLAESWAYDPTGNWRGYEMAATGATPLDQHRVHDRGNRMTQIEGNPHNMILDRAGRMRQLAPDATGNWSGKLEITWDAWSRITSVKNNGEVVGEYTYDGLHRRITREVDEETWHSYYNNQWRPVEERKDAETTASASYLWGARHRDDLVRRDRAVGGTTLNETRYILMDYFNPSAITDEEGEVTERYAFSAFGLRTILNPDYTVRSSSECAMEFSFQGQFVDTESGLMNYGYRYYAPYLGRWTCKDPIKEKGGSNLYEVVRNNAVGAVDLVGLLRKEKSRPRAPTSVELSGPAEVGPIACGINYLMGNVPFLSGGRRSGSNNDTVDINGSGVLDDAKSAFEEQWSEEILNQLLTLATTNTEDNCCEVSKSSFEYNSTTPPGGVLIPITSIGARFTLQRFQVDWEITCENEITIIDSKGRKCGGSYSCEGVFTLNDTFDFAVNDQDNFAEQGACFVLGHIGEPFKITGSWNKSYHGTTHN